MNIKTKFNIGDIVWFTDITHKSEFSNMPESFSSCQGKIQLIKIEINDVNIKKNYMIKPIKKYCHIVEELEEDNIFKTKKGIDKRIKKLNRINNFNDMECYKR